MINEDGLGSIDADKIFVMGDISWQMYENSLDNLQDNSCWRISFLERVFRNYVAESSP
ncbi:hypothetical protein [Okeania sp. SIO2B3]|uniref:hypothetical protein n=1 Tax=Okeania sp. SIO2B3 TaxID=2607784 RepID=UPI0025E393B6|nr:hypothetical protein [Okeania sp. SIO2B3]